MARYNREFLVPYLHDIVALYLADREINQKINALQNQIHQYQAGWAARKPKSPKIQSSSSGCFGMLGGFFLFITIGCVASIIFEPGIVPLWFVVVGVVVVGGLGVFLLISEIQTIRKDDATNEKNRAEYKREMEEYERNIRIAKEMTEQGRAKIPVLERQLTFLRQEKNKANQALSKLYGANIIPSHYRDIYAAVYLYDWFSSSGADDLDAALNIYVLEQIKAKLDIIIERQSETILNQRMILANQHKALEEQRSHNAYMRNKAAQISSSMEEQNRYLGMIEGNTAATAFFAAADYLKD